MVKIRKRIWFIAAAVLTAALLAALARGAALRGESPARQLSLGEKFLAELDYENAALCFEKVIAVDPMNARAYLGLADAYHGMGDLENELITLQKGYEATGDARLSARIEALTRAGDGAGADEAPPEGEDYPPALQARLEELLRCYEAGDMEAAFAIHNDPAFWELCTAQIVEEDYVDLQVENGETASSLLLSYVLEGESGQSQFVSFGTWEENGREGPGIETWWEGWENRVDWRYVTGGWSGNKMNGPMECTNVGYEDGVWTGTDVANGMVIDDYWHGDVITTQTYPLEGEIETRQMRSTYDHGVNITVDEDGNRTRDGDPGVVLGEISLNGLWRGYFPIEDARRPRGPMA